MASLAADFRVAIVGGGIGGLVCALSVAHFCPGLKVDVYEQAEEYKEIGAGVGIGVNAAKLLHRFGLGELINNIVGNRDGIWISFRRGDNGEEILTPLADDKKTIRQAPCHRAELLDILQEQIRERNAATLHTRKCLRSVTESGDEVILNFEDGSTATANLVVGCDGIHSKVRAQFAVDNPRYSGRIAYRGLVPIEKIESFWPLPSYSAAWLAKDKHFLVFPICQNRTLNIVAFASKRREELHDLRESWTTTTQRAEVEEEYKDFNETVRKTIALMPERPGKWLLNDREPLEKWVYLDGKVVLMGDAAHAMLPHQGAGAGQAIEDGYILGRVMKDYLTSISSASDTIPNKLVHWMNLYQAVRLPRAQKVQRTSRQAGEIYELQTESMRGKSLDECIPEIQAKLRDRMKWIWTDDIDAEYDQMTKSVYHNI